MGDTRTGSGLGSHFGARSDGSAASWVPMRRWIFMTSGSRYEGVGKIVLDDNDPLCCLNGMAGCREDDGNQPSVQAVNVLGNQKYVLVRKDLDAKMLHISRTMMEFA